MQAGIRSKRLRKNFLRDLQHLNCPYYTYEISIIPASGKRDYWHLSKLSGKKRAVAIYFCGKMCYDMRVTNQHSNAKPR